MEKLFYLETRRGAVDKVIETLQGLGLDTEWVKAEYKERRHMNDYEMLMWCESSRYPAYVHRAWQEIIRKCGIRIDY